MDTKFKPKCKTRKVMSVTCGNCERNICTIIIDNNEKEKIADAMTYHTYCSNCGAEVDWSAIYE